MTVSYKINTSYPSVTNISGSSLAYANGTASWVQPNTSLNNSNGTPIMTIPNGENKVVLDEKAALEVKGKILVNGLDLEERLKTIERVLAIPERDAKIEAKYPSLKKKFDDYINTLEKYKTFERLKGDDNETITP